MFNNGYDDKIDFPDFTTAKMLTRNGNRLYVRSLAIIESGIHFFEVETLNIDRGYRSFVGIIHKDYDFANHVGNFWTYNNSGYKYRNGSEGGYGDDFYKSGTRVGVYLDLDNGTVEFFNNGVSQGVAFSNIKGPVQFYVSMCAKDSQYRILPSNLDTYFEYAFNTNNNVITERFSKEEAQGVELLSDTRCKVINGSFMVQSSKKRKKGRQYFEVILHNVMGTINFGFNGCTANLDVNTFDIDNVDLFSDNPIVSEPNPHLILGALIDFDECILEIYENRKKISHINYNIRFNKPLFGYIGSKDAGKIHEMENDDSIIEIVEEAYEEMRDVLVLYD